MENNKIVSKIINYNKNNEISVINPKFIFTFGQAGAGKTSLINIIKKNYEHEKFIIIDADKYRKYYTKLDIINNKTDIVKITGKFIQSIEKKLLLYYINLKTNIIFVTSSKDYKEVSEIINILVNNNYKIFFYGILTSFVDAFISTQERYEKQLKSKNKTPRFVNFDFYKKSFYGTRETLQKIINDKRIFKLNFYKRANSISKIPTKISNQDVINFIENEDYSFSREKTIKKIDKLFLTRIKRHASLEEFNVLTNFKNEIGINMEPQFKNYQSFFDIGIDQEYKKKFVTLCCTISNVKKKRSYRNRAILKYLKNQELSKEEKNLCDLVLSGKIYQNDKNEYNHCELCNSNINPIKISNSYFYWDIVIPTRPYYPGSIMLILKNRKEKKIEDIQDLSDVEFEELKCLIIELYNIAKKEIKDFKIVGINVLFNQISKSQLCIHGHVEFMLSEAHKQNIGYHLNNKRKYDKLTKLINDEMNNRDIVKVKEGIKIDLIKNDYTTVKNILTEYDNLIKKYVEIAKTVRDANIATNYLDKLYIHNLSPSPVNYICITYYMDKFVLSSIPEILLDSVDIDLLDENNEYHLYTLKVNQFAKDKKDLLLEHESPFIRPSTKIENKRPDYEKVKKFDNKIKKIFDK